MHTDVPFFQNTRDNTHCFQASMRMILKYFLPKENFTWKQLDALSAKKKGKWTWPTQMLLNLKERGFDIVVIDAFDSDAFIERGGAYLIERWGKEMGEAQIKNSDIEQERRLFKIYKERMTVEKRPPTFSDMKKLLQQGYLIECNVNSYALNELEGYAGHSVLVYAMDADNIHLHDPGLPPRPQRKVPKEIFRKAWMYPTNQDQPLVAIRWLPSS